MSMNVLAALAYTRLNWPVCPIEPNQKKPPLTNQGILDATTNASQIVSWWERTPDANIAIRTGCGFFALDVDPRNGGDASLSALQGIYGALPPTVQSKTPGAGRHILFKYDNRPLKGKLGAGIDIKAKNSYVVAAGSSVAEGTYKWEHSPWDTTMVAAPEWVLNLLEPEVGQPVADNGSRAKFERARKYMLATPGAVSGQNGHSVTFGLARKLVREFSLDDISALEVLTEYNNRCEPPWTQAELIRKISQGRKSRK